LLYQTLKFADLLLLDLGQMGLPFRLGPNLPLVAGTVDHGTGLTALWDIDRQFQTLLSLEL
jgi:hypothetical protein